MIKRILALALSTVLVQPLFAQTYGWEPFAPSAGDPRTCTSALRGRTYFNTTSSEWKFCNGTTWVGVPEQQTLTNPSFYQFPYDQGNSGSGVTSDPIIASNNQTRWWRFQIDRKITVDFLIFNVATASAGALCGVAVYNADGTTRLINGGGADCATTGIKSVDVTNTTIGPGSFILAYTSTSTAVQPTTYNFATNSMNILNATVAQSGSAANNGASGVPPTTLGVLSSASQHKIFVKFQG